MEQQLAVTDSEQQVALQKYENENIFLLCFLDIAYKPRRANLLIIPHLIANCLCCDSFTKLTANKLIHYMLQAHLQIE